MTRQLERAAAQLELVPIKLRDARAWIAERHRHNEPPHAWKFGVGLEVDGELCGVAIAAVPKARLLDDGRTLEVTRTCTDGTKNANSMLYGALARAAKALGYKRLITYTLESEPGASLRAAGFCVVAAGLEEGTSWSRSSRQRQDETLFGARRPLAAKQRWERAL